MKSNQKGFGVVEIVLVLIVVGFIAVLSWWVWQSNTNSQQKVTTAQNKDKEQAPSKQIIELKEYKNDSVKLSFRYPAGWSLKEDLGNPRGIGNEGTIAVTSPAGVIVSIEPNYGGKGGGCIDDPADKPHNTSNCNTLEILSKEKVAAQSNIEETDRDGKDIYLYRFKYTEARQATATPPPSTYGIFLSNDKELITVSKPIIGALFNNGFIRRSDGPVIETSVTGKGLTDPEKLKSDEVKQAEDILRSLQLL